MIFIAIIGINVILDRMICQDFFRFGHWYFYHSILFRISCLEFIIALNAGMLFHLLGWEYLVYFLGWEWDNYKQKSNCTED